MAASAKAEEFSFLYELEDEDGGFFLLDDQEGKILRKFLINLI